MRAPGASLTAPETVAFGLTSPNRTVSSMRATTSSFIRSRSQG